MKLEKREITLNEQDSLKDIYYFEKQLLSAYEKGTANAVRKDVQNELTALLEGLRQDCQRLAKRIN